MYAYKTENRVDKEILTLLLLSFFASFGHLNVFMRDTNNKTLVLEVLCL